MDDNSNQAVGKIENLERIADQFNAVFAGIGNNRFRAEIFSRLKNAGYNLVTLIHPTAYVSSSAVIREGTIIQSKTIVNVYSVIGIGSIIGLGTIIDHDVVIGDCCHINSGAIIGAGAKTDDYVKVGAGEIVLGFDKEKYTK